ncbi:hypothetical protein [Thermococcus peptonophilus]|uniref:Uncharacterized protein n=1 Tax=Thermococcus peptonophilus TaxID=53952 RepID=A0A142CSX8_9EURY|nr:hypothetical protein [Thermococcus peptonophilus]AMQ17880.1 hypothetical protein A0127_01175 [Thermococcus peptonophilus]
MESGIFKAEARFSWEALKRITSRPDILIGSLPFPGSLDGKTVSIRIPGRVFGFEFSGSFEMTYADKTATYIMKSPLGLLIVTIQLGEKFLVCRASADLNERFLRKKLLKIAEGFGRTVLAFSESYERVIPKIRQEHSKIVASDLKPGDLIHLARYVRFFGGKDTFEIIGTGKGEIKIKVKGGDLEGIEFREDGTLAIVEIKKPLLDVSEDELSDLGIGGRYVFNVLWG